VARIFGTDGVRGLANDNLTPELALDIGFALVTVLREEGVNRPELLIGRDPRWSGLMLLAGLVAGITSAGGDAVDLGILPTPAVAHLTEANGASAGLVISASHNPMSDNGIKVFGHDGFKLTDAEEDRLLDLLGSRTGKRPQGTDVGRMRIDHRSRERYIGHVVAAAGADLEGLRVVVDGANGAASDVSPEVLRRLGAEVIEVACRPDGANINDGVGSTYPDVIAKAVLEHGADVGIAHDGDADRVIAATAGGEEVDGDLILAILAQAAQQAGTLSNNAVATTVMTNLGFRQAMDRLGIGVIETKVGDRYVLAAMKEHGLVLGGEQSGHLIALDCATTGDGVLTAARLLGTMTATHRSLADLATVMTRLPQVLVNVRDVAKAQLDKADAVWAAVHAEEALLGDQGRVLVRPSGTEQLVRVMVEAPTQADAQASADRIARAVTAELAI